MDFYPVFNRIAPTLFALITVVIYAATRFVAGWDIPTSLACTAFAGVILVIVGLFTPARDVEEQAETLFWLGAATVLLALFLGVYSANLGRAFVSLAFLGIVVPLALIAVTNQWDDWRHGAPDMLGLYMAVIPVPVMALVDIHGEGFFIVNGIGLITTLITIIVAVVTNPFEEAKSNPL